MEKRGLIGLIILSVIVVVVVASGSAAVYFYNFYVFETVRVCVGAANDTGFSCNVTRDCFDLAEENGITIDLGDAPNFVKDHFQKVVDEAVYCDGTCFVKNVRGVNRETQELEMLGSCEVGEVEFAVDISGKEGLEVLEWMKGRNA